jgi:hypothetical protein
MAKPLAEKLNPAWQAAVKRMLATPPQPLGAVKVGPLNATHCIGSRRVASYSL